MKQAYTTINMRQSSIKMIERINVIIAEYLRAGFMLTVRQLYYQLVARDIIPNTIQSYKNITGLVNDGRMCGLIDWDVIEDRTREVTDRSKWSSANSILESAANSFHMDMWETQQHRVMIIVEKEALAGVMQRICHELSMPMLAARGYPSVTVIRELALGKMRSAALDGQRVQILHLGDHDPSGLDMTRDLEDRLSIFQPGHSWEIERIALNMDQVEEKNLPENPAKTTDSRFAQYAERFGESSWELDALEPQYLVDLVRHHAEKYIDPVAWRAKEAEIAQVKEKLNWVAENFDDLDME